MADIDTLKNFVQNACDAVEFKLLRSRDDVNNEDTFPPDMAHQIFGENENIFGYKNLKITIMYCAGDMYNCIIKRYSNEIEDEDGIKADNVTEKIISKLPEDCCCSSVDELLKKVDNAEAFKPFGEKLSELIVEEEQGNKRHFEIYQCDGTNSKFIKYFCRLETMVLWFVDAASYIDTDDPKWMYFICYEKFQNADGNTQYASVGYSTVYQFYAFPQCIRPRISQMLILPPFQKMGLGTKMVETIYKHFCTEDVVDITVEDPSEGFQRIRNYMDAKLCMTLPSFDKDVIKKGFNEEMVNEARQKFKVNPKQCRIVYEILRLYYTNTNDPEDYRGYRLDIKKRLNLTYHKQLHEIKTLQKAKVDTQLMLASLPSIEERIEQLKEEYEKVEVGYMAIVERLK